MTSRYHPQHIKVATAVLTAVVYHTPSLNNMKLLIITALVACAAADVSHILARSAEADAKILRQEQDVGLEGIYRWAYETENGISAQETGALNNPQSENAAQTAQGQARWTAPNGEVVELQYTADENGYQAQGSHLPTPPPIPEAILKALEFIRAHPPPPEKN